MNIDEDKKDAIQNKDDSLSEVKTGFNAERKIETKDLNEKKEIDSVFEKKALKKEDNIENKIENILSNKKENDVVIEKEKDVSTIEKTTTLNKSISSDLSESTGDLQFDKRVINQKNEYVSTETVGSKNISVNAYLEESEENFVVKRNDQNTDTKDFLSAMFSKNPVFVLMLGLGPALAVTTKLTNGIGLGVIVLITTLLSNVVVSSLKGFIPSQIRLPFYLTITGTFASVIIIFVQAFFSDLATSLGIFLPLTAVNSVVLERAEVFSCKKKTISTVLNSLGTGIGFMLVLILISFIREFFGTLQLDFSDFGLGVYDFDKISILGIPIYEHAKIFVMPAGAFLTLGLLLAIKQTICNYSNKNIEE